jgi:hypothetical protein
LIINRISARLQGHGLCGFGDTAFIYDRGDTMSGWRMEQQWEEEQNLRRISKSKELQTLSINTPEARWRQRQCKTERNLWLPDGLPFAYYLAIDCLRPSCPKCMHFTFFFAKTV